MLVLPKPVTPVLRGIADRSQRGGSLQSPRPALLTTGGVTPERTICETSQPRGACRGVTTKCHMDPRRDPGADKGHHVKTQKT